MLPGLEADGHCACLVLCPFDSFGSLKANALMQGKNVLGQLPGAKLVTLPSFPVGQQKTIRKKEEVALDELGAGVGIDEAEGEEEEDAFDALSDPLAVEADDLPSVAADGGRNSRKCSAWRVWATTGSICRGL